MGTEGYEGFSQVEWYRAFFEGSVRAGAAGAMFDTHARRGTRFGLPIPIVTRSAGGSFSCSQMFASLASADPPDRLTDDNRYLVPRQFAWLRPEGDPATQR